MLNDPATQTGLSFRAAFLRLFIAGLNDNQRNVLQRRLNNHAAAANGEPVVALTDAERMSLTRIGKRAARRLAALLPDGRIPKNMNAAEAIDFYAQLTPALLAKAAALPPYEAMGAQAAPEATHTATPPEPNTVH